MNTGSAVAHTFTATDSKAVNCGTTVVLQLTYTPASATTNLISLGTTSTSGAVNTANVIFADSNNIADAQIYTVTVSAKYSG